MSHTGIQRHARLSSQASRRQQASTKLSPQHSGELFAVCAQEGGRGGRWRRELPCHVPVQVRGKEGGKSARCSGGGEGPTPKVPTCKSRERRNSAFPSMHSRLMPPLHPRNECVSERCALWKRELGGPVFSLSEVSDVCSQAWLPALLLAFWV